MGIIDCNESRLAACMDLGLCVHQEAGCNMPTIRIRNPFGAIPIRRESFLRRKNIMGYSDNEESVRVDFFVHSGKWYCTEAVIWTGRFNAGLIHDEFAQSLRDHFQESPSSRCDMDAICLEPYHLHAHPIQIKSGGWVLKGT